MKDIDEYLGHIDSRGPDAADHNESIAGISIRVGSGVWDPGKGKSTKMFLEVLDGYPIRPDTSVLDIGTGSGILSLFLYRKGLRDILATDNMSESVANAKDNMKRNGASEVRVSESDLFSNIEETFDLILFNAPATHPKRRNLPRILEPLWSAEENIRVRFLKSLSRFLNPGGAALLMYSKFSDFDPIPHEVLETFPFEYKILRTSKGEMSESGIIEIRHKGIDTPPQETSS